MTLTERTGRNAVAAVLLIAGGGAVTLTGLSYGVGSLQDMGAGFMPVVFGTLLVAMGCLVGLFETRGEDTETGGECSGEVFIHGRGTACILAGTLSFIFVCQYAGLVPAAFACVFIAALGDRTNTVRQAVLLAAGWAAVTGVGFGYGLDLGLPLFAWG